MTTEEPRWFTAVMCPIPTCYMTATHRHSAEAVEAGEAARGIVNGQKLLDAIARATTMPAYIEMTGGGVATAYVGELVDDRFCLAIGPGTFGGYEDPAASRFYLGDDLYIGPDDHGESDLVRSAATLDEVTTAVREVLRAMGHGVEVIE